MMREWYVAGRCCAGGGWCCAMAWIFLVLWVSHIRSRILQIQSDCGKRLYHFMLFGVYAGVILLGPFVQVIERAFLFKPCFMFLLLTLRLNAQSRTSQHFLSDLFIFEAHVRSCAAKPRQAVKISSSHRTSHGSRWAQFCVGRSLCSFMLSQQLSNLFPAIPGVVLHQIQEIPSHKFHWMN